MRIKVDPKSLRQTKWHECAIRFVLGGAITVIAALLAKKFGPAVGGLFLAFPAIFSASATLVEKHEAEKKVQKGLHGEKRGRDAAALDAAGALMGSFGLGLFALMVWILLPEHSASLTLLGAAVLWFVSSLLSLARARASATNLWLRTSRKARHACISRIVGSKSTFARSPDHPILFTHNAVPQQDRHSQHVVLESK